MEPSSAFHKKPFQCGRPVTSYIETSHRKYLNFDFSEMKSSLNQAQQSNTITVPDPPKQSENSLDFRKLPQQLETTKKQASKAQFPDSKENTNDGNVREKNNENIAQKQHKPRTEALKPID